LVEEEGGEKRKEMGRKSPAHSAGGRRGSPARVKKDGGEGLAGVILFKIS
jgi:hypothetical protein